MEGEPGQASRHSEAGTQGPRLPWERPRRASLLSVPAKPGASAGPPGGIVRGMPIARVVITKEIDYRQRKERWSNGYRFDLPTIDTATIQALATALITMERPLHGDRVRFVYANGGRDAPKAQAVYVEEFATPQTGAGTSAVVHPETCVMIESKRRQRVYARKFFHTLQLTPAAAATSEALKAADVTFVNTTVAKLTNGTLPGGAVYCWPDGTPVTVPFTADPFFRTRQFDRRGKRPTQAAPQTP